MSVSPPAPPLPSPGEDDLSGRALGDYRIQRKLGRGAMAEVYLAVQRSLNRSVALKVLHGSAAQDEKYIERFRREAQAAAALSHANIVQIYEVGCFEGVHFIAQEYVAGCNLAEYLDRRGSPLDARTAVGILRQAAAALDRAASRGIVHRDIKPENIMLGAGGEVKVADFGLARLTSDERAQALTQAGFTMGTPLYMSPEQIEAKPLDPRSDIYSLGITAYQMLAGRTPFQADTAVAVAMQHLRGEPIALEEIRRDVPPALSRLVMRMIAKNPDDRPESARNLLQELRKLSGGDAEDLEQEFELGPPTSSPTTSAARLAATQHLTAVMSAPPAAAQSAGRSMRSWWWVLLAAAMFLLGIAWARSRQDRPLLPAVPLPGQSHSRDALAADENASLPRAEPFGPLSYVAQALRVAIP